MEPRPAATVVVARRAADGPEILVLGRSPASRFAPGFVVFPGGAVEDGDADLAVRWYGTPSEAARACAVRELYEETGILATADGLRAFDGPDRGGRSGPGAGMAAEPSAAAPVPGRRSIEAIDFEPPRPEAMPEMSRWVAPAFLAIRFDARFYALEGPGGLDVVPDGVEISRAWWAGATSVLAEQAAGEAPLMWPTLVILRALGECRSVGDVLALRVEQVEPTGGRQPAEPGSA